MTPSMGGLRRSPTKLENRPKGRQKTNAVMPIPLMTRRLVGLRARAFPHFPYHLWPRFWPAVRPRAVSLPPNQESWFSLPVCEIWHCESETITFLIHFQFKFLFQLRINFWEMPRNRNHNYLWIWIDTALVRPASDAWCTASRPSF